MTLTVVVYNVVRHSVRDMGFRTVAQVTGAYQFITATEFRGLAKTLVFLVFGNLEAMLDVW